MQIPQNDMNGILIKSLSADVAEMKQRFNAIGKGLESALQVLKGISNRLAVIDSSVGVLIDRDPTLGKIDFVHEFPAWFKSQKEKHDKQAETMANIVLPKDKKDDPKQSA